MKQITDKIKISIGALESTSRAEQTFISIKSSGHIENYSVLASQELSFYDSNYFVKQALKGKPWAIYTLANMYKDGICVRKDLSKALHWYEIGARKNDDSCQYALYEIYRKGEVAQPNMHKALFWLKQAAEGGNSFACYELALIYLDGENENYNYDLYAKWLKKSAQFGNTHAVYDLGKLYEEKKDYVSAYKCYHKAAKLGHKQAVYSLAELVSREFRQAEKRIKTAKAFLKKLVKMGDKEAGEILNSFL